MNIRQSAANHLKKQYMFLDENKDGSRKVSILGKLIPTDMITIQYKWWTESPRAQRNVLPYMARRRQKERRGQRQQKADWYKNPRAKIGEEINHDRKPAIIGWELFQKILQLHTINEVVLYEARSYTVNNEARLSLKLYQR